MINTTDQARQFTQTVTCFRSNLGRPLDLVCLTGRFLDQGISLETIKRAYDAALAEGPTADYTQRLSPGASELLAELTRIVTDPPSSLNGRSRTFVIASALASATVFNHLGPRDLQAAYEASKDLVSLDLPTWEVLRPEIVQRITSIRTFLRGGAPARWQRQEVLGPQRPSVWPLSARPTFRPRPRRTTLWGDGSPE
ncbi:MAG: hypothetical protein M3442_06975 [Chloroflexota bacterium]|nr:hypothetical protein [Chloroflexota bacterium]